MSLPAEISGGCYFEQKYRRRGTGGPRAARSLVPLPEGLRSDLLDLDFDIHASWKLEALKAVDGLGVGLQDVDQTLVDSHLEMLPRVLVLVRGTNHTEAVLLGGQGDRAPERRIGAGYGFDDLGRALIDDLMVIGLETDPNFLGSGRRSW